MRDAANDRVFLLVRENFCFCFEVDANGVQIPPTPGGVLTCHPTEL